MWVTPQKQAKIGKCLAGVRRQANVTQVALAKLLGKPQSFVSSYEAGQRRIDLLEFIFITEALGADPRKVFSEIVGVKPKRRS